MKRFARIAPALGLTLGLCLALFGPLGLAVGSYSYVGDYSYDPASLGGLVTDESGTPLEGICVEVYGSETWDVVETDVAGRYTMPGLHSGEHRVFFASNECAGPSAYLGEWYSDKATYSTADGIPLAEGEERTGIDAVLVLGGSISGRVTDEAGDPLPGICVDATDAAEGHGFLSYTETGPDGRYLVHGLPTGGYKLRFEHCSQGRYLTEWYDDKEFEEQADPIAVTARQHTAGIDAQLARAGSISGRVTDEDGHPLGGAQVTLRLADGAFTSGFALTNFDGSYSIVDLPPEQYKVRFQRSQGGFQEEWFDDKASLENADPVQVGSGQEVTSVDAALRGPGVVVTETGGSIQVGEGGPTDTYQVALKTRPSLSVTVRPQGNAQVTVSPTSLFFTSSTWNSPKTVTVSAVNDTAQEGPHEAQVTHTVTSSDPNYNGIPAPGVLVSIADNDVPKTATSAMYTGQTSVRRNEVAQLSATLRNAVTGDPLAGKTVSFALKSGSSTRWTVAGTTDASGVVSATRQVTDIVGSYSLVTSFAGDATFAASSATTPFSVTAHPTSLTYTGPSSVLRNDPATLSAHLTDAFGAPLAGRSVTFRVKQGPVLFRTLSGTTNTQGIASATYTASDSPGAYTVESSFASDGTLAASSDADPLGILKRPTALTYTGPAGALIQSMPTLTARLTDATTGGPLSSRQVMFVLLDGSATVVSAAATTNASGVASADVQVPGPAGSRTLEVRFAGDASFDPRMVPSPFEVERRPTLLSASPSGDRMYTQVMALQGTLRDQLSGQGIQGAELSFELTKDGASVGTGTAVTDANGLGTLELTDIVPGTYGLRVTYAGDSARAPSEALSELVVVPAETSISGVSSQVAVRGTTATVNATLRTNGTPLPGRTLVFRLGSQQEEAVTDASGQATVQMPVTESYGTHTLTTEFEGDGLYLPSSHSRTFTVRWEVGFADARDPTHQVWLNGITKEFQVVIPGDSSAVKSDPSMSETPLPDGSSWITIRYMDADLTLVGSFRRQGTLFGTAVKTPQNAYLLFN